MKKIILVLAATFAFLAAQAQTIKGSIDHTNWVPNTESTVSINSIPTTIAQFKSLQEAIGTEPQGAVMLMLVAMEMYRNNHTVGEEAIKLCNTEINVPSVMRRVKEIFGNDQSYARPHLVATFFQGATPMNGFNPKKPYTIKVRVNPVNKYQESQILKGYVLYLQVYSNGYDTPWRGCEVVRCKGEKFYRVSNCPSMYVQCKDVDWKSDAEFKGL